MRSNAHRTKLLLGGCLLLCLAIVTCSSFISKTFSIVFYIEEQFGSTDEQINKEMVDLTENEDWEEHHEKIKRIDSVEFAVKMTNYEATEATGQIYISDNGSLTTHAMIQDSALLVLDGIVLQPGETRVVERAESIQYIRNYEEMRDFVINGFFYVYAIAENVPFDVVTEDSMAVIVSFTAENK